MLEGGLVPPGGLAMSALAMFCQSSQQNFDSYHEAIRESHGTTQQQ